MVWHSPICRQTYKSPKWHHQAKIEFHLSSNYQLQRSLGKSEQHCGTASNSVVPKSVDKFGENVPLAFVQHLPLKVDFAFGRRQTVGRLSGGNTSVMTSFMNATNFFS